MRSYLLAIIVLSLWACNHQEVEDPTGPGTDTPPQGTILKNETIQSQIMGGMQHYAIYLPPGYDTSSVDYPLLYLLHGMYGNYLDWPSHGLARITNKAIHDGSIVPMIIVMPNGLDAFYCNNFEGGDILWEDYFIEEFIPEIESTYRIKTNGGSRAIAGLSMGGYGTTFHAFKRPWMFCCAYSMSGPLNKGSSAPDLENIIDALSEEELMQVPDYYMECGTEDNLYPSNVDFAAYLSKKNVPYTFVQRQGTHNWAFFEACLPNALEAASEQFDQ